MSDSMKALREKRAAELAAKKEKLAAMRKQREDARRSAEAAPAEKSVASDASFNSYIDSVLSETAPPAPAVQPSTTLVPPEQPDGDATTAASASAAAPPGSSAGSNQGKMAALTTVTERISMFN